MSQYYPPYRSSSSNIKVELNLANYATKTNQNNITHLDVSSFASKTNLAALNTEVDKIDADKLKTTPADLAKLTKLQQKEYIINKNERGLSFNRGFFLYTDQSYLKYECKIGSFGFGLTSRDITEWKSTGIYNHSSDSNMNAVADTKTNLPNFKNDGRVHVYLSGNHFQQNVADIPNNDNVINIYCVYKLDPIASTRDTSFTTQDALFGAMQITKNATDSDQNNYKGYSICFDERSQFGHTMAEGGRTHITNGRNELIFGADMSFSVHATNKANHIYLMGDGLTQGINDTTIYAEKKYFRNFTEPKLKTAPADLAKLTNAIENDVVKKTDYNTKVISTEAQIAGRTKNTVDNLADITRLKAIDTNSFVTRTKFSADTNALDDKIDGVEKKTNISGLATKNSLNDYLKTSTFNSKVTEVENKIKDADIITKNAVTKANTIRSDLTAYAKKDEVATDITTIKNDCVTNASLSSQLNDLKSQHIATEVTGIDNKTKNNASDILAVKNKLQQKEYIINKNERGLSFNRGFFLYTDQSYLKYECKIGSFGFGLTSTDITEWKLTGIYNHSSDSNMNAVADTKTNLPNFKNDGRMHVYLSGNHFQQNVAGIPNNDNVINIYCVYKLDPIASTRDTSFTTQDALFGAMQITKNATDSDKNNYQGYGICFDERSQFGHTMAEGGRTHITNGRNVLIFGADMSFSVHATNKANHIYLMGDGLTQGINDTTIYAEKIYFRNFTEPNVKFVLSLHYNGDDSYLFVNGRQELKFKCKTDQLVKEKLCIGNLSDQWTASETEKNRVIGKYL